MILSKSIIITVILFGLLVCLSLSSNLDIPFYEIISISVLFWTGVIVFFYTKETQKANQISEQPILLINADHAKGATEFNIYNGGNGPAFNIDMEIFLLNHHYSFSNKKQKDNKLDSLPAGKYTGGITFDMIFRNRENIFPNNGPHAVDKFIYDVFRDTYQGGNVGTREPAKMVFVFNDAQQRKYRAEFNLVPHTEQDWEYVEQPWQEGFHEKFTCIFMHSGQKIF